MPSPASIRRKHGIERDEADDTDESTFWRKVALMENGDLIAIFSDLGMIRLTRDSELVWAKPNHAHHDLEITDERIYVLTRTLVRADAFKGSIPVVDDRITVLDHRGNTLENYSLLSALIRSDYMGFSDFYRGQRDVLHTNTLELLTDLPGNLGETFGEGNFLVSFNAMNTVGVLDRSEETLSWTLPGARGGSGHPER